MQSAPRDHFHYERLYQTKTAMMRNTLPAGLCTLLVFIVCLEISARYILSSETGSAGLALVRVKTTGHISSSSSSSPESRRNTKILIAVPNYSNKASVYVEQLIDSFRDICEAGFDVHLALYKTSPFEPAKEQLLNSRIAPCYSGANFTWNVILKPSSTGLTFASFHRQHFFDHANDYDLFVYAEDDMLVRLRHVVGYLDETARVKQTLLLAAASASDDKDDDDAYQNKDFFDYSIGFVRYEHRHNPEARSVFEFKKHQDWKAIPGFNGRYMTTPAHHHQAMYMATREQLLTWGQRCECFRNTSVIDVHAHYYRERISSMCLYNECNVTQLIPLDAHFEDFTIHHLADKYWNNSHWAPYGKTGLEMQAIRYGIIQNIIDSTKTRATNNANMTATTTPRTVATASSAKTTNKITATFAH